MLTQTFFYLVCLSQFHYIDIKMTTYIDNNYPMRVKYGTYLTVKDSYLEYSTNSESGIEDVATPTEYQFDPFYLTTKIKKAITSTYKQCMTYDQICNYLIQSEKDFFSRREEKGWKNQVLQILEDSFSSSIGYSELLNRSEQWDSSIDKSYREETFWEVTEYNQSSRNIYTVEIDY